MFFQKVFPEKYERNYKKFFLKLNQENLYGVFNFLKPNLLMYVLQSLQGQFSGFHLLILLLETSRLGNSLQVIGTIFYIIGTRQNIISVL